MFTPEHVHALISRILHAEQDAYGDILDACEKLYETLLDITGEKSPVEENRANLSLESGDALGLTWAAMCIKDIVRTKRFMEAVYEATRDKLEKNPGRPVQILYAGTGPFATLVLPLTAHFTCEQVQFTLLEVNERSFISLQKLIRTMNLEKFISHTALADATKWMLPPGRAVDIFICEAMQQALRKEPQVSIGMNIVPQLSTGTILVPGEIIVKAALLDPEKRMQEKMQGVKDTGAVITLQTVFTLTRDTLLQYASTGARPGVQTSGSLPGTTVHIRKEQSGSHPVLCLMTEIGIYRNKKLMMDESALTLPLKLADLERGWEGKIHFQYQTGRDPGIRLSGI